MTIRLRPKARLFVVLAFLGLAHAATAEGPWMDEADLKTTFSGQTIAGLYPSGRMFVETYHRGGRVAYRDDVRNVGGRWGVKASSFCTIYDGDASGGCYSVRRMGENCFEFYFLARTDSESRRPEEPNWTAQAWLSNKPSTCVAGTEV